MTVWAIAWLTDLPPLESKVVVLLGSMAVGVNVYLMSQKFNVITGPAAASMLFSTVFAAVTTPIWMMLMTLAGYYQKSPSAGVLNGYFLSGENLLSRFGTNQILKSTQ